MTSSLEYVSKVTYGYDTENFSQETNQNPSGLIRHDTAYSALLVIGRGNRTTTTRHDVTGQTSAVTSTVRYDIAGSPVAQIDPLGRKVTINYADSYNDTTTTRNTFAYPTTLTDPKGKSSTIKYRFDTGVNVWARSPKPDGLYNTYGKTTSRTYEDGTGRISKEMLDTNGAYTRYSYSTNGTDIRSYSTIKHDGTGLPGTGDEVETLTITDGAGRVLKTRTENPGSSGGYTGKKVTYDILGRTTAESTLTEINSSWVPTGDDSAWHWNTQVYDWKGRVTQTIPTDSTGSDGKDTLISYEGCGCAGGQRTTIKGPAVIAYNQSGGLETNPKRRVQMIYEDILGRTNKTEIWDLDGNGATTPYSTTTTAFNGRDQAIRMREFSGSDQSSTYQDTTTAYDGHGRVSSVHKPEWFDALNGNAPTYTTYTYNADDAVATMTDPRGAESTYTYENDSGTPKRPLVTAIAYATPNPNPSPSATEAHSVTLQYDDAGNRTSMTDGSGTLTYEYDELSRLKTETKHFDPAPASQPQAGYILTYEYNLNGSVKSITDPFNYKVAYATDKAGRTTSIGNATIPTAYASGISYRAFGGVKAMSLSATQSIDLNFDYDAAQRISSYTAHSNANSQVDIHNAQYAYNNDGTVSGIANNALATFSQVNRFDFVGRMKYNSVGQTGVSYSYEQTLGYDAFGDMTDRTNRLYSFSPEYFNATYTNNRKTLGGSTDTFDKAGNVVVSDTGSDHK